MKTRIYSVDITSVLLDSLKAGKTEISLAIANPAVNDIQYFFHANEMAPVYPPTLQIIHNSDQLRYDKCNDTIVTRTKKGITPSNEIKMFPNPVYNFINIQSSTASQQVNIYTLQSKLVHQTQFNSKEVKLDVSGLNKGVYLLEIIHVDGNRDINKIIKY